MEVRITNENEKFAPKISVTGDGDTVIDGSFGNRCIKDISLVVETARDESMTLL